MNKREVMFSKGHLDLWKITCDNGMTCYKITDDGSGICNSIEEMSGYYKKGTEIDLVNEIIKRDNPVVFTDDATYEEYMEQFDIYAEGGEPENPIYPYCTFKTYEKAKEIWDLLEG